MHGLGALGDDGDGLAAVEHAVAGAAVADAAAEQRVLAGEQAGLSRAHAEDDAAGLHEVAAHGEGVRVAHGQDLLHKAVHELRAHPGGVLAQGGEQLRAGDGGQAGVVVDALGAGEPAALIGAADHERLAAALAGGDGGGEAGGACADDGDVVHADPSREFFAHGRVFAPRLCYDRDIPPQCSRRTRCAQGGREENAALPR